MEHTGATKEEKITLLTLRNVMDKIGGNLYEAKADLEYVVNGKSKNQEDCEKAEERQAPTLEALHSQLQDLLDVAHTCQGLVSDLRS